MPLPRAHKRRCSWCSAYSLSKSGISSRCFTNRTLRSANGSKIFPPTAERAYPRYAQSSGRATWTISRLQSDELASPQGQPHLCSLASYITARMSLLLLSSANLQNPRISFDGVWCQRRSARRTATKAGETKIQMKTVALAVAVVSSVIGQTSSIRPARRP
jgi:hypothetical protein